MTFRMSLSAFDTFMIVQLITLSIIAFQAIIDWNSNSHEQPEACRRGGMSVKEATLQIQIRTRSARRIHFVSLSSEGMIVNTYETGVSSQNQEDNEEDHGVCPLEGNHGRVHKGHTGVGIRRHDLESRVPVTSDKSLQKGVIWQKSFTKHCPTVGAR